MKWLCGFIFVIILLSGCTTTTVSPSQSSRRTIDSTFQKQTLVLQAQMDSLCASIYQTIFDAAVDSIMTVRKEEMNILVK
jgi:hypothetical protein